MIAYNTQRRNVRITLGFGLLGLVMILAPALGYIDIMNGGGALILLGLLFFITSIPVAVMFHNRSKLVDDLYSGDDVLVHWIYDPGLWAEYAQEEEIRDAAGKKMLFFIITAFALFFGVVFLIIDPKGGGPVTFLVMIALIIIIGLTALISIRVSARRNRTGNAEVYISSRGLYLNKVLHSWGHINTRLESVQIVMARVPIIEFTYSFPTRAGIQHETVNVPIPQGEMPAAQRVAEYFNRAGEKKPSINLP